MSIATKYVNHWKIYNGPESECVCAETEKIPEGTFEKRQKVG